MEKPKKKLVKVLQQKPSVISTNSSIREDTKQVKASKKPKGKRTIASIESS